jgi:glycosyltransferase involved in cell wall biosynthesis
MRILYFSRDYTTHDHRFLTALSKTSHQVFYLRLEDGGLTLDKRPLPQGIEHMEWAGGHKPATLRDGLHLVNDLRRVIHRVKPDLIQAGPIQRSAFLVALAGFHPLLSMSWGYDLLYDAHINPFCRWATRFTLRHSDAMLGDCNTIRKLAISFGMREDRIVTFPWGIDLRQFNYLSPPSMDKTIFSLLSTRSWEPIYGIDVIARAFVIAARMRPELRLTLLGNGSQAASIRQSLLIGAAYDRVSFPGIIPNAELPDYFCNADVYVGASHSDGTSISLLEAFATGKPAIVPDIPGNREWIIPGENGWLFTDGDVDGLASTIMSAMDQRQSLPIMGRKARLVAEARADWEKNFPQLETAYALALR